MFNSSDSVDPVAMSGSALDGAGKDPIDSLQSSSGTCSADDQCSKVGDQQTPSQRRIDCLYGLDIIFLPPNPSAPIEDELPSDCIEDESADDEFFGNTSAPTLILEDLRIDETDIQYEPDYVGLSAESQHLTFAEIQLKNTTSGVLTAPRDALGIPDSDIWRFIKEFVSQLDPQMIWQIARVKDADATARILHPILHESFMRKMRAQHQYPTHVMTKVMFGILESLVLHFQNFYDGPHIIAFGDYPPFVRHIASDLQNATQAALDRGRAIHNGKMSNLVRQAHQRRLDQFASPTRDQEDRLELSAGRKVEVFMNGVKERIKVGAMVEVQQPDHRKAFRYVDLHFESVIQVRKGDSAHLCELFKSRPEMSPSELLGILDKCVEAHVDDQILLGYKEGIFYAPKGVRLSFLCKHFNSITRDLDVTI